MTMEQLSDFNIDACEYCGEFHRVAWYDADDGGDCLLCDKCLEMYEFEEVT